MRATTIACVVVLLSAGAVRAGRPEQAWTVEKLKGSDGLAERLAGYYEPVEVKVKADAPGYELPLDLSKLTNAAMAEARRLGPVDEAAAAKFRKLLKENGFAALDVNTGDDVAEFYKQVKVRGQPIFITSDSLLHLYHVQFGQTLKDIEEREFFGDAKAISKALQAEAIRLHESSKGEVREAARLLVGYTTVPLVLLHRTGLAGDAAEALKKVRSWGAKPHPGQMRSFGRKYGEVIEELAKAKLIRRHAWHDKRQLLVALERYVKANPTGKEADKALIPDVVADDVRAELKRIADHAGFAPSPLMGYKEDYSQYVPRGHYTRSKRLQLYFKALMWYGRMTFLIRGTDDEAGVQGLVPIERARTQTRAAALLAAMMETKLPDGRTVANAWDRLYAVTAYYVGFADDLTPYDYRRAVRSAIGKRLTRASLADAKKVFELRKALAKMRKPRIYSGTGALEGPPPEIADEKTLAEALALTQGMRLMGQRYIPDSYMMGKLVYPTVGKFTGRGEPFTMVVSQVGKVRGFPRGVDVMAVLGSDRARGWLKELGDDQYARYDEKLAELTEQFAAVDRAGWNRNMYWSWLYALQALLKEYDTGYPTFMQTSAWRDKQLSAALASWSQLRHDTILYAKQSHTMVATGLPARPKMVEGYVEPVPEFYARLLALTRMTRRGLGEMEVLDEPAMARLDDLERIVQRLLTISRAELANEKLSDKDYSFIRNFGHQLEGVVAGVDAEGLETTIVADVHTDGNSGKVLEEGTGYLHPMMVVYPMPDGGLVAGVGPVLPHYEFKQPMSQRLTDGAWKKMLRGKQPPALPAWGRSFTAD
jgi:hypothetical protein